jgi:hypothetical protein
MTLISFKNVRAPLPKEKNKENLEGGLVHHPLREYE